MEPKLMYDPIVDILYIVYSHKYVEIFCKNWNYWRVCDDPWVWYDCKSDIEIPWE